MRSDRQASKAEQRNGCGWATSGSLSLRSRASFCSSSGAKCSAYCTAHIHAQRNEMSNTSTRATSQVSKPMSVEAVEARGLTRTARESTTGADGARSRHTCGGQRWKHASSASKRSVTKLGKAERGARLGAQTYFAEAEQELVERHRRCNGAQKQGQQRDMGQQQGQPQISAAPNGRFEWAKSQCRDQDKN